MSNFQRVVIMLEPLRHILDRSAIVLASQSPRRREVLQNIGKLNIIIRPSNAEENLEKSKYEAKSFNYTMDTAALKTDAVFESVETEYENKDLLVIGCDTVVTYKGSIYEKPKDKEDALRILNTLNGTDHEVYSGMKLIWKPLKGEKKELSFYEETKVNFASVSEDVLRGYIETGEPMDKAGGYGIQGVGASLVQGIKGDYFNVMGFPFHTFCVKLTELLKI